MKAFSTEKHQQIIEKLKTVRNNQCGSGWWDLNRVISVYTTEHIIAQNMSEKKDEADEKEVTKTDVLRLEKTIKYFKEKTKNNSFTISLLENELKTAKNKISVKAIFGTIVFLEDAEGEDIAIVKELTEVKRFESIEKVDDYYIDELCSIGDYIIPSIFKGRIVIDTI